MAVEEMVKDSVDYRDHDYLTGIKDDGQKAVYLADLIITENLGLEELVAKMRITCEKVLYYFAVILLENYPEKYHELVDFILKRGMQRKQDFQYLKNVREPYNEETLNQNIAMLIYYKKRIAELKYGLNDYPVLTDFEIAVVVKTAGHQVFKSRVNQIERLLVAYANGEKTAPQSSPSKFLDENDMWTEFVCEDENDVSAAISSLEDEELKNFLVLRYYKQWGFNKLAQEFNIPVREVYQKLYQALTLAEESLKEIKAKREINNSSNFGTV